MANKNLISGDFFRQYYLSNKTKEPITLGWFAINPNLISNKSIRRKSHGEWFTIKSEHNKKIHRILRFSPNLKASSEEEGKSCIVIDWMGWLELGDFPEDVPESMVIEISKTPFFKQFFIGLKHPDPSQRIPSIISLISLVLGVLSMVLAFIL